MITRPLSARQIKAARALLDWSQRDLVKVSGLSLAAIRKIELGYISPRKTTMDAISGALQFAGIEFMERDGVRRRSENICIYDGAGCGEEFFDDLYKTARKSKTEIMIAASTVSAFSKLCGLKNFQKLNSLCDLCEGISIRCMAYKVSVEGKSPSAVQVRILPKIYSDISMLCIYGQKLAIAVPKGEAISKIIVVESSKLSAFAKGTFLGLWEKSKQAN